MHHRIAPISAALLSAAAAGLVATGAASAAGGTPTRTAPARAGAADFPGAAWVPANRRNWRPATRPLSTPITRIIIHTTESSAASAIGFFQSPRARASAQYVISADGAITQMVRDRDISFNSGNRQYNDTSIAIEHEAFSNNCASFTQAMYQSSARLVAFLVTKYRIPVDRTHIIGHYQVPDPKHPGQFGGIHHHTDPGRCWNWTEYMSLIQADLPAAGNAAGAPSS